MEKILLIGPKLTQDEAVNQFIGREGYETIHAADRERGIHSVNEDKPVVVMVDHNLENDNGLEVLKEIRQLDKRCEVILVTNGGEVDVAIEVLRAGALDYLRRPIDVELLRVALGRARERRAQRQLVFDRPHILILEDHEPTRVRLARVLEKEGYHVFVAPNGQEGMEIFRTNRIDLILADVKMPIMSGTEVLRETKGQGADVEFIVITGYGDEDVVVQALRDGAINFLKKPIDIEQMLLAVQKALEYQRVRRSLAHRNRDVEIMQELVVRLTDKLELVVETPNMMSPQAREFLHQLIDALPLGIAVIGTNRQIMFANQHIIKTVGETPRTLSAQWLEKVGISQVEEDKLDEAFNRMMRANPGSVETLAISQWAFLIMTPLRLVKPDLTERFVAVAIRGERSRKRD